MTKTRKLKITIDENELNRIKGKNLEIELIITHANIKVSTNNRVDFLLEKVDVKNENRDN